MELDACRNLETLNVSHFMPKWPLMKDSNESRYYKHLNTLKDFSTKIQEKNTDLLDLIKKSHAQKNKDLTECSSLVYYYNLYLRSYNDSPDVKFDDFKYIFNVELEDFKAAIISEGMKAFGSYWLLIIYSKKDSKLRILPIQNNNCLFDSNFNDKTDVALLAINLWEHAYYRTFNNNKLSYLQEFTKCLDWSFAIDNLRANSGFPYVIPKLPYGVDALAPYINQETVNLHYFKHHMSYYSNFNKLMVGSFPEKKMSLENIMRTVRLPDNIYNQAAQAFNHDIYWNCMVPAKNAPIPIPSELEKALIKHFKSIATFKDTFKQLALNHVGSGWVWLSLDNEKNLTLCSLSNAENPYKYNNFPLLGCDIWEHAYILDYNTSLEKYIDAFWHIINWEYVANRYLNIMKS